MEIYILDRIEEDTAVLEGPDGKMFCVFASLLPQNSKDGDCFCVKEEKFIFLDEETKKRRKAMSSLLSGIISKN